MAATCGRAQGNAVRLGAAVLVAFAAMGAASAQIPDVRIRLDATGSLYVPADSTSAIRAYSLFGIPSVASLRLTFESGFTGFVSQRLQRVPHDGDPDQLDQFYVEDEGIWRVGKQLLPFGSGQMLHEDAIAVRGDTSLIFEGLPLAVAICDSGAGRQRGVVGRIGNSSNGASFAIGQHFGISSSSLTEIRLPEESPGVGEGWSDAFGADFSRRVGNTRLKAEALLLRNGASPLDKDVSMLDLSATFKQAPFDSIVIGYTREVTRRYRIARVMGSVPLTDNVSMNPYIRFKDARLWNLGFEIRVRL